MNTEDHKKKAVQFYGKFAGLAMQMFFILLAAAIGGQWLDARFETPKPYFTIVLILIGLAGVLYKVVKDLSN